MAVGVNPMEPFMPNPSKASNPLLATFAPWLLAVPAANDQGSAASAASYWGPSFETQARLWGQIIDVQRSFWSFYLPMLQVAPNFLNGAAQAVADDEVGLEPAETVDGIPDAFELQMRTWNHFLDANRSFWTAINWPGLGTNGESTEEAPGGEAEVETTTSSSAPRKRARAKR